MNIAELAPKKSLALSTVSAHTTSGQSAHVRIEPSTGWVSINLKELWKYRELIYFFAWRNIKVRYKQRLLGSAWPIIQLIFTMVVFSVLFGSLAKMSSEYVPYPIFCFAVLLHLDYS